MELDLGEWIQLQLARKNWLEPQTIALYAKILKPGDVMADVGAHVGFHSLIGRQIVGANGLIIAIEPQPYNAHKIMRNWRANGYSNLKLYIAAGGVDGGRADLFDQEYTDRAILSLANNAAKNEQQSFQVPILRLDSIIIENNLPLLRLLKIDVEGYELEVIQGLGEKLVSVQHIIFECFRRLLVKGPKWFFNC